MSEKIMLAHGGGGEEMNELINGLVFEIFGASGGVLGENNDSAVLDINSSKIAFSTDSFVVSPIKFSGGDIGKIAVCGTINDLAMVGAVPKYLSCALIIEEGFDINELKNILISMKNTADEAGAIIVCGDTKVVPKGAADKIFINTSGVGEFINGPIKTSGLKSGAKIILSGDIGRHGAVILAAREELALDTNLSSDCKALNKIVQELFKNGIKPLAMRDATRGGLSAVLNEWAAAAKRNIKIYEENIAINPAVSGVCELLGFEAFELANEGTFILAVDSEMADLAVNILKKYNENAAIIGEVLEPENRVNSIFANSVATYRVIIQNAYGASRFLEPPKGELLPRIC